MQVTHTHLHMLTCNMQQVAYQHTTQYSNIMHVTHTHLHMSITHGVANTHITCEFATLILHVGISQRITYTRGTCEHNTFAHDCACVYSACVCMTVHVCTAYVYA